MDYEDTWEPATQRMRRILDRHGLISRLGADTHTLMMELADLILWTEREHQDIVIELLREHCLIHAETPEVVTILRSMEVILLSRRRKTMTAEQELELSLVT